MKFDASKLTNGTLLLIGVSYRNAQPGGDTRGRVNPKTYTYALLKAGGLWYMSGTGQVPQAAGWGAVERWLGKDGRRLEWVKGTHQDQLLDLWAAEPEPTLDPVQESLRADLERQVDEAIGHGRPIVGRKYERDLDDEADGIPDVHGNFS